MGDAMFVNNFSIKKCGFHLLYPPFSKGRNESQILIFGKAYAKEYFTVMRGLECKNAYFRGDELHELINETIKMILNNYSLVKKIHNETFELYEKVHAFANELAALDWTKLSNNKLAKLFIDFVDLQEVAHAHALATTWFVDSEEDFSKYLANLTNEYVAKSGVNLDPADVFSILTTPNKNSLQIIEEIESLQVLKIISSNRSDKKIITNLTDCTTIPVGLSDKSIEAIVHHFEKWHWEPYGYLGPAYKIDHYLQTWVSQLNAGLNISKEMKNLKARPNNVKHEKADLFKKLGVAPKDKKTFDMAADIIFLKGYRKDYAFNFFFVLVEHIYAELTYRFNVSLDELLMMSNPEIKELIISGGRYNKDLVRERYALSIMSFNNGKFEILSGKKAEKFLLDKKDEIKIDDVNYEQTEFKGMCACAGYARGAVKIVNDVSDMPKMEKGDIMVAHTTFPSLVPAMKKAAAIVTDDGGITCHAAIVSRELRVPCVVGVKVVTKVLHDGELVEVEANKGIVRKIIDVI
jgi:phosphohistidine swiveling domain-containing protein